MESVHPNQTVRPETRVPRTGSGSSAFRSQPLRCSLSVHSGVSHRYFHAEAKSFPEGLSWTPSLVQNGDNEGGVNHGARPNAATPLRLRRLTKYSGMPKGLPD